MLGEHAGGYYFAAEITITSEPESRAAAPTRQMSCRFSQPIGYAYSWSLYEIVGHRRTLSCNEQAQCPLL